MQKPKRTQNVSLRRGITLLLIVFWIAPYLLVVGGSGLLSAVNNRRHTASLMEAQSTSAIETLRRDLDGLVSESTRSSYVSTVRGAYTQYLRDGDSGTLYNTLHQFLVDYYSRSYRVRAVYLVFSDPSLAGNNVYYTINNLYASFRDVQAFHSLGMEETCLSLIPDLGSDIAFVRAGDRLYLVRILSLRGNRFEPYAALAMEIDVATLLDSVSHMPLLHSASVRIDGVALHLGDKDLFSQDPSAGYSKDLYISRGLNTGDRFDIEYIITADAHTLLRESRSAVYVELLLALLAIPLLGVFYYYFSRRITAPIETLGRFAHNIEEGDFGTQVDAVALGSAEFTSLGICLNAMSARLDDQFQRILSEELALRDARIKALQSHIDPHFLGNTLEIINWEARLAGSVKVSRMLEALSTLLEATVDRRGRTLVHLSEEMAYVGAYLTIISERLGKRLTIKQEIDPALLDWMVPRLILQPLVENAIEHGVSRKQKGHVTIRARKLEEGWMALEVENDSPLSPEDEARIAALLRDGAMPGGHATGNIGIRNVDERLRMLYGERSALTVQNTESGSTLSSICIHDSTDKQNPSI